MAYSIDLRERVLAFYDEGHSQQETIATFRISQSALNSWLRLRKETGNLKKKPVSNFPSKYESAKLRQYIEEHPFALLKEIAAYFGGSISGACDALKREKVIAPYYYDWSTNSEWFEIWLEWHLCPLLKPGSVLVLDNARFHRKSEVERIAKIFRLQVLWLPPYSPDKNKIEKVWENLKNFIRRQGRKFKSLQQSIDSYFKT